MDRKENIVQYLGMAMRLLAYAIFLGFFRVLFYYATASLYRSEPSLQHTLNDLIHALSLQEMRYNVQASILFSLLLLAINLPVWILLRIPSSRKYKILLPIDLSLLLAIHVLLRASVMIDFHVLSTAITYLALALGLAFTAAFCYANFRIFFREDKVEFAFEFAILEGVLIMIVLTILQLLVSGEIPVMTTGPMLVISAGILVVAIALALGYRLIKTRQPAYLLSLEKIVGVGVIVLGLLFQTGGMRRIYFSSMLASRNPAASLRGALAEPNSRKPNVILLVWDTVRADHLSVYGYQRDTTPFLASLSKNSVVFDRAYATAPHTIPSHCGIFTGLYSSQSNCHWENNRLSLGATTLAETLQKLGYLTLGISNNYALSDFNGFSQGFDIYEVNPQVGIFAGDILWRAILKYFFPEIALDSGAMFTNRIARNWMGEMGKTDHPFFLFINYMEAHLPYVWNRQAYHFFDNPEEFYRKFYYRNISFDDMMCAGGISDEAKDTIVKWYDGSIYYADSQLAQLYYFLEQEGMLENTIVILTSDHGESFGEHNQLGHGLDLYDATLHVPLLIYYRGHLASARIARVTSLRELPEIISALVAGRQPAAIQHADADNEVMAENWRPLLPLDRLEGVCGPGFDASRFDRRQAALISSSHKLIWDSRGQDEYYDLAADPGETVNLYGQDSPEFSRMDSEMKDFIATSPISKLMNFSELDPKTKKALRALGYAK